MYRWTICSLLLLLKQPLMFAQPEQKSLVPGPERTLEMLRSMEPNNPWMAAGGASSEHNDAYSSNVSPQPGPGSGPIRITVTKMGAVCPTIVLDSKGYLFAYCVDTANRTASLRMLTPDTLTLLASEEMPSSGRLGGFYMYMDAQDRVVLGAGDNRMLRISHSKDASGRWHFQTVNRWDLSRVVEGHCGAASCDYLESVMPDWSGKIWFSTEGGIVGTVDAKSAAVHSTQLPAGEQVANSISSSPTGVSVASDHALYLFGSAKDGTPVVQWREPYDRGSRIKPGQLSHGTGATPVFFGREGHPYLAITDNAEPQEDLLVYRVGSANQTRRLICRIPVFPSGASANENGPIGIGDSVIVTNTYGYDYRNFSGSGLNQLPGGLTRIDVRRDGSGCDTVWTNPISSAAVPKLSIRDGIVYTFTRTITDSRPRYLLAAIDFRTGATLKQTVVSDSYASDTFQLASAISPSGVLYQPALTGIIQARPETPAQRRAFDRSNAAP
jgi:hypothetical protein